MVYCVGGSERDLLGDYDFNPFVDEELDYDEDMEDLPPADSAAHPDLKEVVEVEEEEEEEEDGEDKDDQSKEVVVRGACCVLHACLCITCVSLCLLVSCCVYGR